MRRREPFRPIAGRNFVGRKGRPSFTSHLAVCNSGVENLLGIKLHYSANFWPRGESCVSFLGGLLERGMIVDPVNTILLERPLVSSNSAYETNGGRYGLLTACYLNIATDMKQLIIVGATVEIA